MCGQSHCGAYLGVVGKVTDDSANRHGRFLDQRRGGENVLGLGHLWLLDHIDDGEFVTTGKFGFAETPEVGNDEFSPCGTAYHEQFQSITGIRSR